MKLINYTYYNCIKSVHKDWLPYFEQHKEELENILSNVNSYKNEALTVVPHARNLLKAFKYISPQNIKIVILAQDPYTGYEMINNVKVLQACGLAFSIPKSHKKIPPSLQNIFKELSKCYDNFIIPKNGSLTRWAKEENILLLNCALTAILNNANIHKSLWKNYTDEIIKYISSINSKCVFLLMGSFAISKKNLIDISKHKVFETSHPSPLSCYKNFTDTLVFKKINDYLESINEVPINWNLM